jgi:hypothetical protein
MDRRRHRRRLVIRFLIVVVAAVIATLVAAPAAGAQVDDDIDNLVVITGRAQVREGETVDVVFIVDGPAVINGTVRDTVVAIHGDVVVRGTVEDEVVALDGRVVAAGSGHIEGDVVSRHRPIEQGDGRIDGSWERWNPAAWRRGVSIVSRVAVWIAFTVSTVVLGLLLGLLAPQAAAAVDRAARDGIGPAIGWGLLLTIGLPIVAVLTMVSIVGLPLGLGVLLALGLVYGIGYTAGAWLLGRTVARNLHPIPAFLVGWGILRVAALIPVLGGLSWFGAVVVGLGAITVAGYRARTRGEPTPTATAETLAA